MGGVVSFRLIAGDQALAEIEELTQFVIIQGPDHCLGHVDSVSTANAALFGAPGFGEREPDTPAVARIGVSLYQSALNKAVDHPGERRLAEQQVPVQLLCRIGSGHLERV